MEHTQRGSTLPIVDIELAENESVFTESGGMAWMSSNISMESSTRGGVGKAVGRMLSGESLFLVTYTCTQGTGLVTFCSEFPGRIVPFPLEEGASIICQRDVFMAAETSASLQMEFNKKLGAGFFGGEGFILQRVSGPGTAFLEFAGEITEYELQDGQQLRVDPGYIGAFEPSVEYDIQRVEGIKNMLFGGEGIFLATLTGPGKVWLQSMPLQNLAAKLSPYVATGG